MNQHLVVLLYGIQQLIASNKVNSTISYTKALQPISSLRRINRKMQSRFALYGIILVIFVAVQEAEGQLEICTTLLQECNRDEFKIGSKRMVMFSKEKSWEDARQHCEHLGMRLLTTSTKAEVDQLKTYLNSRVSDLPQKTFWHLWLGATDIDQDGVWTWKATGEKLTYTAWAKDEPNGGDKENCLEWKLILYNDVMWNDAKCSIRKRFICEVEDGGLS